jgi:4-hydroxy-tetrahydrodipicolinate reductase
MIKAVVSGANGAMGKTVYKCIASRENVKVIAGIDVNTDSYADFPIVQETNMLPEKPDVIIDFSRPEMLAGLLQYGQAQNVPLVIATTGFSDVQIQSIRKATEIIPVFFTFNMSLGINLLVHLSKKAAEVLGQRNFDIEIIERHHNQKVDAPSGTAVMLADAINEILDNSKTYVYDRHSRRVKRDKKEIGIHAVRGGTIVGEHEVIFAGTDEVVTLSHSASSKTVFAEGAINAAIFLAGKKAGLYDMSALLDN